MKKQPVTLGPREEIGVGIVGLGIISLLMPYFSQLVSDLDYVDASPYSILSGSSMVLAVMTIIAGIVVVFIKAEE